jgi:hypothetical protein
LINNPEFKGIVEQMRSSLSEWQEKIYDSALIPESELLKRSKDNNLTIYEMIRKPELYDLKAYLSASELALAKKPDHLPELIEMLAHSDSGIRYWGLIGCLMLKEENEPALPKIFEMLNDESHVNRAFAAWILNEKGQNKASIACLKKLILQDSYALLDIYNIIDYIGKSALPLIPTVTELKTDNKYALRMREYLMAKYATK